MRCNKLGKFSFCMKKFQSKLLLNPRINHILKNMYFFP